MLIVMGPVLGISVADLYAAAFGPGFLLAGLYLVVSRRPRLHQPEARPAGAEGRPRHQSLYLILREVVVGVVPLLGLIAATLGTILAGLATPTEASGIGVAGRADPRRVLPPAHLRGAQACGAQHHGHLEHGAAARGDVQYLRRGVRPHGHGELDHRNAARYAGTAGGHADHRRGADLPSRLAVRVAGGDPRVPADLLSGHRRPEAGARAIARHPRRHADGLVRHPRRGHAADRLSLAAGRHVGVLPAGRWCANGRSRRSTRGCSSS